MLTRVQTRNIPKYVSFGRTEGVRTHSATRGQNPSLTRCLPQSLQTAASLCDNSNIPGQELQNLLPLASTACRTGGRTDPPTALLVSVTLRMLFLALDIPFLLRHLRDVEAGTQGPRVMSPALHFFLVTISTQGCSAVTSLGSCLGDLPELLTPLMFLHLLP